MKKVETIPPRGTMVQFDAVDAEGPIGQRLGDIACEGYVEGYTRDLGVLKMTVRVFPKRRIPPRIVRDFDGDRVPECKTMFVFSLKDGEWDCGGWVKNLRFLNPSS